MPVEWEADSEAPGNSRVSSGLPVDSALHHSVSTSTTAPAPSLSSKQHAPDVPEDDPMRRIWVMDACSLQPWGAWLGTGERLIGARPTRPSPVSGDTAETHPNLSPPYTGSGFPYGSQSPANVAAGCTRRQPLDFFAGVHPEDAPVARDLLAFPPWRRAGFAVGPAGAAESGSGGAGGGGVGGLVRRVRVPVYRRRKTDAGLKKAGEAKGGDDDDDGLRVEWVGPDGVTWTIFECVAWLEAGTFTVVAERPRLKPPLSPHHHHAPTSSSSSGLGQQPAASRYLPHSPFSIIEPMIAVLDSRPGGARGEGDGLFAPTITCIGDMTRELTMQGANSGSSDSSQLARNSMELVPLPRPSMMPAAPTSVVEVVAAADNLSSLSADLLRCLLVASHAGPPTSKGRHPSTTTTRGQGEKRSRQSGSTSINSSSSTESGSVQSSQHQRRGGTADAAPTLVDPSQYRSGGGSSSSPPLSSSTRSSSESSMSDADPSFDGECMEPPLPPPPLEASVEPGALQKQASSSSSAAVFLPPPHPLPLPQVRRFPVPLSGISLAYRQGIGAETLAALLGVSSGSDHGISADHDSKKAKGSGASASAAAQEEEAGLSSMDADPVNNAAQPSLWSHSVALADGSDGGEDSPYGGGGGGSFMWSDARSGGDNNSSSLPRQEESCHSLLEGMASLASSSLGSSPSSAMSAGVGLGSFTGSSYGSQEHDSSLSGQWRTHTQKENWKDKLGKTKVLQPLPAALPWIAFLDLCFSTADDSIAAPLAAALAHPIGVLRVLGLAGNHLTAKGATDLAAGLERNQSLRRLDLSGNKIGDEGASAVARALGCHPRLFELKLDGCGLGLAGAYSLAKHLVALSNSLRRLTVASNALGSDGFALLHAAAAGVVPPSTSSSSSSSAAAVAESRSALVHLDCQFNGISAMAQITGSLANCNLNGLVQSGGGLGSGSSMFPPKLSTGLRELVLTCNTLNDDGAASVARALPFLPHLKDLKVGFNMLGVKGVYPLVRALPHTHVESLDLSGNPLDAPSAWALAFALGHNTTLRKLGLDGTALTGQPSCAGHFAVALIANPKSALTHLSGIQLATALEGLGVRLPSQCSSEFGYGASAAAYLQRPSFEPGGGVSTNCPANTEVLSWLKVLRQAACNHSKAIQEAEREFEKRSNALGSGRRMPVHNTALPYGIHQPRSKTTEQHHGAPRGALRQRLRASTDISEGMLASMSTGSLTNSELGGDENGALTRSFESSGFRDACSEPAGAPPPLPGAPPATAQPMSYHGGGASTGVALAQMLHFPGPPSMGLHIPGFPPPQFPPQFPPPPMPPPPLVPPPAFLPFHAPAAFPAAFPPPNFPWQGSGAQQQQQQPPRLPLVPPASSPPASSSPSAQAAAAAAGGGAGGGGGSRGSGETGFTGAGTVWVERERAAEVFDAVFDPVAFSHAVGLRSLSSSTTEGSDQDLHHTHAHQNAATALPFLAPRSQHGMKVQDSDDGSSRSDTSSPGPPSHSSAQGAMRAGAAGDATTYDREAALWMHAPPPLELLGLPPKLVSALSGGSGQENGGGPTSMLDMLQFIPYDENELRAALELFQIAAGPDLRRGGGGSGGGGSTGGGTGAGGASGSSKDLQTQSLEPPPALGRAKDSKAIAAKMNARRAFANDGVVKAMHARQASDKCTADLVKAGLGEEEAQQVKALDTTTATAATTSRRPGSAGSGASGGGSGGGNTVPTAPSPSSSGSERGAAAATWSSALFDPDSFPGLKLTVEEGLRPGGRRSDSLMAMRAMIYASFYRGAGGWRTKRVLIVDDSKVMRRFLCRLMEREGFATDEAINGQSALELMQQRYYDVAFVDLEMPGMGGLECASALREWEKKIGRTQRQRICAVSSHSRAKEQKALNAGFDSYQNKPIRGKSLLKVVTSDSDSQRDKTPSPKGGSDEQPSGEASFGAPSDTPQQQ